MWENIRYTEKNHVYFKYVHLQKNFYQKKINLKKEIFKISLLFKCMKYEDSNAFLIKLHDIFVF